MRTTTIALLGSVLSLPLLALAAAPAPATAPAISPAAVTSLPVATWAVDPVHSFVGFSTSHKGVSDAHGRFNNISGEVTTAEDITRSKVSLVLEAKSIDTNNASRDEHLRGPDFFNSVQHPRITFESTKIAQRGDKLMVQGNLTLLGKSKPVTATMEMRGPVDNPRGGKLAGFVGDFSFKRSDFGMTYGVEGGGLGDEVKVQISIEVKG